MIRLSIPWGDRAIVIRDAAGAESWFSASELATIAQFRLAKRREEWMLSRMAAKQLAIDRGICREPSSCAIDQRRIGTLHVSLSHSGRYAAAAIAQGPVGIDVQVVRDLRESAGHLFLSDDETKALGGCALPHRLLHFWCAKEAAWKQSGGATPTLKQIPLRLLSEGDRGLRFESVETVAVEDVIVALTV